MVNSQEKGKRGERAMVRFLRDNGFPAAERTKAGKRDDPGDIWVHGIVAPPPIIVSVKNGYTPDPHPGTGQWQDWWADLSTTCLALGGTNTLGLLCHARVGKSDPLYWRWWVDLGWFWDIFDDMGPVQITGGQALRLMRMWK
ncbi:hypothetical protein OV450_3375 [Actinobacteria bacterium OV450]|nr:hypothetical protein OV450_3375 [Actinobacteria bacterium OV450]